MIRVRGMSKSYRTGKLVTPVLEAVDLDVAAGEFVSLVGPSGSGKTTLLHAIGGLDGDYQGLIEVDGTDLRNHNDRALSEYRNGQVGFVFQSFYLLSHLTCEENVALPGLFSRGRDDDREHRARRAHEVLDWVGLGDRATSRPTAMSGGQRQRVAIARALFNRPKLMLCDEPTGNLDRKTGAQIIEIFQRLNRDEGMTVLIVTHDPRVAQATSRTIRVQDGRLHSEAAGEFQARGPGGDAPASGDGPASGDAPPDGNPPSNRAPARGDAPAGAAAQQGPGSEGGRP